MSLAEDGGISTVVVKYVDSRRNVQGEDTYLGYTDAEVWRYGYQSGFETPVVHTDNDKYWVLVLLSIGA